MMRRYRISKMEKIMNLKKAAVAKALNKASTTIPIYLYTTHTHTHTHIAYAYRER
jgi:hypothetical protein